ncbi:hypothetical protein JCM10450v2_004077 [Rhodotorula kratochvilovae]
MDSAGAGASNELPPSHSHVLVHPLATSSVESAQALIHALRSYRRRDAVPPADADAPLPFPTALASPLYHPWRITNKYYTAPVAFRIIPSGDEGEEDVCARLTEGDEPAVVVVAPASSTPSPALLSLLARLSTRIPEFEVALLVTYPPLPSCTAAPSTHATEQAVSVSLASADDEALEPDEPAWDDAALSAGFEWVHLPAALSAPSPPPIGDGEKDADVEEDDPLGRVIAALHAHMWEGMERVEPPARGDAAEGASRTASESPSLGAMGLVDEEDQEEWSALGAPPLPAPRVRPDEAGDAASWTFPERFLPSIARGGDSANGALAHGGGAFEDDFAPFVDAASSARTNASDAAGAFDGAEAPFASSRPVGDANDPFALDVPVDASHFYRHPSSAFPDSSHPPSPPAGRPFVDTDPVDADGDLSSLDALFSRLSTARAATAEMGLDERRAYAERVVRELLGDEALDGLSGSDEEEEEEREAEEGTAARRGGERVGR